MGFLSFLGVVLAFRRVFSGFWGFLCFSFVLLLLVGVGGRVAGGSGVRGLARPGVLLPFRGGRVGGLLPFRGGWAGGCACARLSVLLPPCWGGAGSGCACCPVPVVGVGLCPVSSAACCGGGFRVLFFPSGASCVFWFCGCLVLCWVVVSAGSGGCGGCRVGFGVVFSPASVVLARACFRFPSWGLVWVWVGFCLESLILAQDERWRRA